MRFVFYYSIKMTHNFFSYALVILFLSSFVNSWSIFGSTEDEDKKSNVVNDGNELQPVNSGEGINLKEKIAFEMKIADEKFLLESKIAHEMSPLDACHHRIVAELEGTCSELSEEAVSKLSVQLLNCQSSIEGRPTYVCTSDMAIGECTRDMDAITWNSYQIVSNRARSICYAARQNLFRMRTEHTIDRLLSTSIDQIYTLQSTQAGQERLREVGEETVSRLEKGQERLREGQRTLGAVQASLQESISSSLEELKRDSQLITASNRNLSSVTEIISHKLDNASVKLDEQAATLLSQHEALAERLSLLDSAAEGVMERVEEAGEAVQEMRGEMMDQLSSTLGGMRELNHTLDYLTRGVDDLSHRVTSTSTWIMNAIGSSGDHLVLLSVLLYHSLYFILALFVSVFLCLPSTSRLIVLVSVPLNLILVLRHSSAALELTHLTYTLVLCSLTDVLTRWFYERRRLGIVSNKQIAASRPESDVNAGNVDMRRVISMLEQICRDESRRGTTTQPELSSSASTGYHSGFGAVSSFTSPYLTSPPHIHRVMCPPVPNNPPPTPDNGLNHGPTSSLLNSELFGVRRQLMNTLLGSGVVERREGSVTRSRSKSPARTSTPLRSSSRNSSLNQSVFRAPCLAETRQGNPCKLMSVDGSEYCHKHQAAPSRASSLSHSLTSLPSPCGVTTGTQGALGGSMRF